MPSEFLPVYHFQTVTCTVIQNMVSFSMALFKDLFNLLVPIQVRVFVYFAEQLQVAFGFQELLKCFSTKMCNVLHIIHSKFAFRQSLMNLNI